MKWGIKCEASKAPGFGLGVFALKADKSINVLVLFVVFRVQFYRQRW
jgi:hypothetical protein